MGIIICAFGIIFLLAPLLKLQLAIDNLFRYIFAGLCLLYGGFHGSYRGDEEKITLIE